MNWGIEDVVAAVALITAALIGIALARRLVRNQSLRYILIAGILLVVLAIWAHLAVGIV
jgi:hypothetical protein